MNDVSKDSHGGYINSGVKERVDLVSKCLPRVYMQSDRAGGWPGPAKILHNRGPIDSHPKIPAGESFPVPQTLPGDLLPAFLNMLCPG